jgi:poly(hydroxyalkanoate) granule-associated protein
MLKKAKAGGLAAEAGGAKDLADSVLKSSHHIWLAGLGAFSRAQQEGMKMFEALVQQGERLQDRTRQAAADTAAAARGAASAKAREVQQMAGGTWDKLEQVFEDRVARALAKLGVYTQNDVQRLAERVDELSDAVNRLIKASRAEKAPKARAAGKKGASTKPSAGRKGKAPAGTVKPGSRPAKRATKPS